MGAGVTTRAAVLTASQTIEQCEVEAHDVPASGGWLTVEACGMCGSDWNWYANRAIDSPMILGHEIVATVASLWGAMADRADIEVGDRIVLEEAVPCQACALCRSGRHRLCRTSGRYGGTAIATSPGLWGGYAETVFLSPKATVHRLPKGLDPILAPLFIPISNGLSWLGDAARLKAGESVLVLGPGQHGLAAAAAARHLGAGKVMVVGVDGDQLRLTAAGDLGADLTLNADHASVSEAVLDYTNGVGADIIVDTTPMWTDALATAMALAAVSARIIVVGAKNGQHSPLDTDTLHRKEITVRGVAARESAAIDAALQWLAAEPEAFAPFGGYTVDLDHVEDALLALGGKGPGERPLHAVVIPKAHREETP
ncbi:MAG: Threonine dehydrogenase and related Zn-dependent dehydrogenase [Acidimicrobiia bacterium]|nr:Threonine dehydrogenase and related Zn-dependent dehydrogenase [Acidimicrobiia bacterium]